MKKTSLVLVGFSFVALVACSHGDEKKSAASSPEADRLNAIIKEYSDAGKRLDPYMAPYFNVEEDLDKFGDYPSDDYFNRAKKMYEVALEKLKTVHPEALSPKDLRTYHLFKEDMEVSLREFDYPTRYLQMTQMWNRLHDYIDNSSEALTSFPFDSVKHYEAFVKRSEGFPAYVDRQIALLKEGVKKKVVLSCIVAKKIPVTYKDALEKNVEKNPFYRPVGFMPKTFSEADRQRLSQEFRKVVTDRILPGFQKFDHYFRTEYTPHCRSGFGLSSLPNGLAWYNYEILANTNLPLDAKQIHQTGLNEVARITTEMEKVKNQLGFKGSLHDFIRSLSKDPKYFFTDAKDMFHAFETVKAQTAAVVPTEFAFIPKSDFKLVESSNPEDASGSYREPTENLPYGRFVVNTMNLKSVPIYEVTTLLMHETVPGHHFQLALQFEMKDELSEYQRKMYGSTSFVEGWALYAEYLGNEMGMYKDPMQRLGNLNDEMLRAVRLVVDTGIHAMGWSQKKAMAYAARYLASDPKEIETEINRYSVWPGQALGYKIGQLKILELRHKAEKGLGPKFDIKGFHKAVIGNGTVSLNVLEGQVNEWIQQTAAK